jgi:hypothetical protein
MHTHTHTHNCFLDSFYSISKGKYLLTEALSLQFCMQGSMAAVYYQTTIVLLCPVTLHYVILQSIVTFWQTSTHFGEKRVCKEKYNAQVRGKSHLLLPPSRNNLRTGCFAKKAPMFFHLKHSVPPQHALSLFPVQLPATLSCSTGSRLQIPPATITGSLMTPP